MGRNAEGILIYIPTRQVEENEEWSSIDPELYEEIAEDEVLVYLMASGR